MKKILVFLVISLLILSGCSKQADISKEEWYPILINDLKESGIDYSNISLKKKVKDGKIQLNVKTETETLLAEIRKEADSNNGEWFTHSVKSLDPEKYYYLNSVYDGGKIAIYDFKSQTLKEEETVSKEIDLNAFSNVNSKQQMMIQDFNKFNKATDKPVTLTLSKATQNISGAGKGNITITYSSAEVKLDIVFREDSTFVAMLVESNDDTKNDAYIGAFAATIMMEVFGFSENDKASIVKLSEKEVSGIFNGFEVSQFSLDTVNMLTITNPEA